jgi:hypothetical protein
MELCRSSVKLDHDVPICNAVMERNMEEVVLYCPMCHGRLLAADTPAPGHPPHRLPGETFFCPSCEMFVEPERGADTASTTDPAAHPIDAPPSDRGRARAAGSNAGGSQRGDSSDEGATQWRKDPIDDERNTWQDKD